MSTQVQYRRGSNVQVAAFTGALGELVIDTTNKVVVVNDGSTVGGFPQVGLTASQTITNKIYNGTSLSVTGNVSAAGATINGDLVVTGNATLSGNIVGDRITNGTTSIEIQTTGGNANVSVGGTSNVAVFTTGGINVTGAVSASGTVTAASTVGGVITGSSVSVTGTATAASTVGGVITGSSASVSGTVTAASTVGGVITGSSASVSGNITGGNASITTQINTTSLSASGNIRTAGTISATGAITGASVVGGVMTGSSLSVSGAVTAASTVGGIITGSSSSVTGAQTAASTVGGIITGSSISVSGAVTTASDISITGNIVDAAALTVTTGSNGNITLSPNGTGVIVVNKDIVNGQANATGNIGSATAYFNTVFAKATSAQYADLAEMYLADQYYTPGTVIEFGGFAEVTQSTSSHSTSVAGIVSTNPSYLMNATLEGANVAAVALVGRVPCRVVGQINKGDRLVSSDRPGVATALNTNQYQPGCIVGKALESYNSDQVGIIEVAVGRH